MTELQAQAKIEPFIFQIFVFCLELLPREFPETFEILKLLLNNKHSYYNYNTINPQKDVVVLYLDFKPYKNIRMSYLGNIPLSFLFARSQNQYLMRADIKPI